MNCLDCKPFLNRKCFSTCDFPSLPLNHIVLFLADTHVSRSLNIPPPTFKKVVLICLFKRNICYRIYTLKRISNWSLYSINLSHFFVCNVNTNLSIYRKETRVHVQNRPCGTVGVEIAVGLGFLLHDMEFVEFDRNVFLVDCLFKRHNICR